MTGFRLEATDGAARTGRLLTPHGDVRTPAFMPVATLGSVRGLDPEDLRRLETDIVLANAYHLYLRPGVDVVEDLGGLHSFMGWHGPLLTDSGGFQSRVPGGGVRRGSGRKRDHRVILSGQMPKLERGGQRWSKEGWTCWSC